MANIIYKTNPFEVVQSLLTLSGELYTSFGCQIHSETGERFFTCSIRLPNGDLAYGSGDSFQEAHHRAATDAPIPGQKVAA